MEESRFEVIMWVLDEIDPGLSNMSKMIFHELLVIVNLIILLSILVYR